ncbi:MAG: type II secretion system protein GspC [bacterium]
MLKRYLWIRNILFVIALSYLAAGVGNTVLLSRLPPPAPAPDRPAVSKPGPQSPDGKAANTYSLITRRNVFNSAYTGEALDSDTGKVQPASAPLKKADLNVKLIGTVAGSREDSFAIIEDGSTRLQELYQADDTIQDQARILQIERCKIILLRDGVQEVLECPEEAVPEEQKSAVAYGAPAGASAAPAGVKAVSETEFMIDENEVEKAMGNINQLLTQIRVVPNFQDGKPNGFKVFAIKPDSLFAKIGLKNGDVIQKVNGRDITSPERALEVFQELRNEKSLSVDMLRRGAPQSLRYEVR